MRTNLLNEQHREVRVRVMWGILNTFRLPSLERRRESRREPCLGERLLLANDGGNGLGQVDRGYLWHSNILLLPFTLRRRCRNTEDTVSWLSSDIVCTERTL